MYGYDHSAWMFGGGFAMLLRWLVPIALIVAAVVYLGRRRGQDGPKKSALDILKERNAQGEIGKDEFEQKKRDIAR